MSTITLDATIAELAPEVNHQTRVRCSAHPDADTWDEGFIDYAGRSACRLACREDGHAAGETYLAWYVIPVLA